jgi:AcrR family transcriptional regulator
MKAAPLTGAVQRRERGRPPNRRPLQHAALLEAAARRINESGPASLSLSSIGEEVGLSRSSVYYYCRDSTDLAAQCFQATCARLQHVLAVVCAEHNEADAQLAAFAQRLFAFDGPTNAVINDLDVLALDARSDIAARAEASVDAIAVIIRRGGRQGVFRPVDETLTARSILALASWATVSLPWLGRRDGPHMRSRVAAAISSLVLDGLGAPGCATPVVQASADDLRPAPGNPFDRKHAADEKTEHLLATASRMFNRRGLDGVTLEEIGAELGATKGALYPYIRDKADLIAKCYDRAFDIYDAIMDLGVRAGGTGLERAAHVIHVNVQAQTGRLSPLSLQPASSHLSPTKHAELRDRARRLKVIAGRNLSAGIRDGSCRLSDPALTSELSAGLYLWMPKWTPAEVDAAGLAAAIVDLAVHGVRQRKS